MQNIYRIEMNEIEYERTYTKYNRIMWSFKNGPIGSNRITHMVEVYDDLDDPNLAGVSYLFGVLDIIPNGHRTGPFVEVMCGHGDPIDETKVGFGGVYIDVNMGKV